MSNKSIRWFFIIKFRLNWFRMTLPIPLVVLYEVFDDLESIIGFLRFLVRGQRISVNNHQVSAEEGFRMIEELLKGCSQIKYVEPFDLVDLVTPKVSIKISIK